MRKLILVSSAVLLLFSCSDNEKTKKDVRDTIILNEDQKNRREQDDDIDLEEPVAEKPVIYIYNNTQDTISLKLDMQGELTNVYPQLSKNNEWKVIANTTGKLLNTIDKREYAYLYYEGKPTGISPNINEGFVVGKSEVVSFLEAKLDEMGMNYQESNDMISYWLPQLTQKEYVFIKFQFNEECNIYSQLEITPTPESEFRLMMEFLPLDEKIKTKPQKIQSFEREKFTVVEWGGVNMTDIVNL